MINKLKQMLPYILDDLVIARKILLFILTLAGTFVIFCALFAGMVLSVNFGGYLGAFGYGLAVLLLGWIISLFVRTSSNKEEKEREPFILNFK